MIIRMYSPADDEQILALWNTAGAKAGYAPLNMDKLHALLLHHPCFCPEHTFVLTEKGQAQGFVNGCTGDTLPHGAERGYISCVLLSQGYDTKENTHLLLSALEGSFRSKGKTIAAVTFFNPIRLPWVIPGTNGHQHNNMPGIPVDLPLYTYMTSLGYRKAAEEMAMYMDLSAFTFPDRIKEKEKKMAEEGYSVDWYREGVHKGVDEMVASLNNSMWSDEIPPAAHSGMKLLVGLCGNTVAGFTGPVYPESTGRGYFAGLAVEKKYEKHGLGTLLFYKLCQAEKECGAGYMSLFTGVDNPAQEIYKGAGFTARRYFGVMLKELSK